jgi:outer membrane protein TolC
MKQSRLALHAPFLKTILLVSFAVAPVAAQGPPAPTAKGPATPATLRLTLEEAKERALSSNKLLGLAGMNVQAKGFAVRAMQANYFPLVTGTALYLHFNDDLGTVLATTGRTVTGPHGTPLLTFPANVINVAVLQQDTSLFNINIAQPITDLLKVRQGVKIARADQEIAQADLEKGMRAVASGVEQLYWGLLAAHKLQAGAREAIVGAEMLAKTKNLDARIALVQTRQALQQVSQQIADLGEQMNGLLDLPAGTVLELVEPPLPLLPYQSADEVVALALGASPEVHAAQLTILKADAAVTAGKLEYVPSIAVLGGYVNQQAASYIQPNIGYVGVVGKYTFLHGGERRAVIRERDTLRAMASLKLAQVQDEVRQKAEKAFREIGESQEALKTVQELVLLRQQAVKKETTPEAMKNPKDLIKATTDLMTAEVDAVKAELAYRQAHVKLTILVGDGCFQGHGPTGYPAGGRKAR